ncbi:hypothetical protein B0A49_07030 [Cryomyces minteri]|uniref:HIT domain-containing protein n=1 Tax=Cryomyces minteri TaxID=331657 RepID=A0A4U0XCV0_9PEZI|nr:hypothetical protein B0A49_07030 [Cryomyces minteri]
MPSSTFKTVTGAKSTSVAIPAAAPTPSASIDRRVTEKDHKLVAAILPGISVPAAVTAAGVRPLCRWVLAVFKATHKGVDFLGEKSPAYADYFEKVARGTTRAAANNAEGAGDVASGTVEGAPVHGSVGAIEDAPAHGAVDDVEGLSGSTVEGAAAAAEEAGSTTLLLEGAADLAVTEASAIDAGFAADVAPSVVSAFEAGAAEIAASPEEVGTLLETSWAQDVRLESWLESIAPHRGTWELEKSESEPELTKSESSEPETPQPESPEPATPRPATPEPVTSEPEMVEPESPRLDSPPPKSPGSESVGSEPSQPQTPEAHTPESQTTEQEMVRPGSPQTGTPQPETPPPGSPQQKPSVPSSPPPGSPLPEAEKSLPESPSLESPGSPRPGSLPEEPLPEAAIPLPESPRPESLRPESPESARPASPQPGMPHAVPETPPPASPEPGSPETESPLPESGIPLPESPPSELPQPDARRPETPRPDASKADTPEPEGQRTKKPIKFLEPETSEQEKVRHRHIEAEARRLYKLERAPDGATLKEKIKWFNDRSKLSIPQTDGSGNVEQYTDAEIGQVLEKLEHELGHDSVPQATATPEETHHLKLVHEAEEYSQSQSKKGSWHSKHATRKYQKHDRKYWDVHAEEEAKLLLEMKKPPMARVERLINHFSKPDVPQVDGPGERHYTEAQLRDALKEIEHERAQEEARVKLEQKAMKEHNKAEKYAKKCAHWLAKDPKRNKGYVVASIVTFGGSDLLRKVAIKHYWSAEAWADGQDKEAVKTALRKVAEAAGQSLEDGEEAKRVVLDAVIALEDCSYFNAGHGSVLNRDGRHELEAGIVDGRTGHYGAVACLTTIKNPIVAANLMLAGGPALVVGPALENMAQTSSALETVENKYFSTPLRELQWQRKTQQMERGEPSNGWEFGTVGVVALDRYGGLAAGGSTGGTTCKIPGRIGDTAILNAGLLATTEVAIVCGAGDEILRRGIAAKIAMYQQNMATSLDEVTHRAVLEMAEASNQPCAVLALDSEGNLSIQSAARIFSMASCSSTQSASASLFPTTLPVFPQHRVVETPYIMAGLSRYPTARGQVTAVTRDGDLLWSNNLVSHIAVAQRIVRTLKSMYSVARCALVSDGSDTFSIVPLHGPLAAFGPISNTREEFDEFFPGWIVSNEGPRMDDRRLYSVCEQIRAISGYRAQYDAIPDSDGVFTRTIHKESLQWKVWEDESHVAFLAAYPNTPGLTVLMPKAELGSDIFELSADDLSDLVRAASTVAQILRRALNVRRCGMIMEGYERQQGHIKLIPIHETQNDDESPSDCGSQEEFKETYPGWVTSKLGPPLNDRRELAEQASVVRALLKQ